MLRKTIKYKDFDGTPKESTHYFNISEPQLVELEVEHDAGFEGMLNLIIETKDRKKLVALFKSIVLMAYGVQEREGDTLYFNQDDDVKKKFTRTQAYNTLYMELATDEQAAADFMEAVLPETTTKKSTGDSDKPEPPTSPSV